MSTKFLKHPEISNISKSDDLIQHPTDRQPFLELRQISKLYGDFTALDNLNLSLKRGEILGYIGPNGAGKTTTMKIIVGLIRSYKGTILLDGKTVNKLENSIHKILGYLPQDVGFQTWRTVYHLLDTFGRLSGYDTDKLPARIDDVLQKVGLKDVKHKKIVHLSSGMQQKLRLAQALLHEPQFLVLDEPMTGLDPSSRYQMKKIIRQLADENITIFLSSHILSDVQDIADRIAIINHGKILNVGTPQELQAKFNVGNEIEIIFGENQKILPDFMKIPQVAHTKKISANKTVLTLKPKINLDQALVSIMNELTNQKCIVRSFNLLQPSLEEVYLRYVEEDD
ncbi:MAG: hypothetical protein DRO88_02675 [Promethearchaeia archaeon]|nr:MAG: hypothetical protein DRO88_02675 [Candidatus Lokiarchaeia archaeon]